MANFSIYEFGAHFKYINSKMEAFEKEYIKEKKLNISPREFEYIALVGNNPFVSMQDIIANESISKSTFSNMMKALSKKNLVKERDYERKDKRKRYLMLTDEGEKFYQHWRKAREIIWEKYMEILTDKEAEQMLAIGLKLTNNFRIQANKKK